jgi:hypothetical protein
LLPFAEFSINNSIHSSTQFSPFFANYRFHPRADLLSSIGEENDIKATTLLNYSVLLPELKENLDHAKDTYKRYADKNRLDLIMQPGELVLLSTKNIKTDRPSKKLDYKYIGPFRIIQQIGKTAYKLALPASYKIHNVFHVSLLTPYKGLSDVRTNPTPVTPVVIDGFEEYVVESILDYKLIRRKPHYLVKWEGFPLSDATWEPVGNLRSCPAKLQAFREAQTQRMKPHQTTIQMGSAETSFEPLAINLTETTPAKQTKGFPTPLPQASNTVVNQEQLPSILVTKGTTLPDSNDSTVQHLKSKLILCRGLVPQDLLMNPPVLPTTELPTLLLNSEAGEVETVEDSSATTTSSVTNSNA